MTGAFSLFLGLALMGGVGDGPRVTPGEFRTWFEAAAEGKLLIDEEVERRAGRYRYVFVEGFRNEGMPGYFAQNVKELRARGVPREAIHVIEPSSDKTVGENAGDVREAFREAAGAGPERLVVIAHSRGACDALAFALRHPKFVRDRVRALFLVQGPFGGTGVADYVTGEGPPMGREVPLRQRAVGGLIAGLEKRQLNRGRHGGLADLTRSASQDFWERLCDEHADAIPVVGPKTFYVTTETRPSRLGPLRRAPARYLHEHFGPNDGVVALDDQSLPDVGTVLAVLDAGHTDLTGRFPSARGGRQLRRALIQCVVAAVGRTDDPAPRPSPERGRRERP
jgi:pimeloyl-ACP methyl ester carboxylesterase